MLISILLPKKPSSLSYSITPLFDTPELDKLKYCSLQVKVLGMDHALISLKYSLL